LTKWPEIWLKIDIRILRAYDTFMATPELSPRISSTDVDTKIDIMRAAGIDPIQIGRMRLLRDQVRSGTRGELTIEYKRSMFLKYLYDTGKLHD
jgi:hypothetical protein